MRILEVNFQQFVAKATVVERYTKNVNKASYRRCQVSSRSSSSIKAIHIWKTKRVPRPAKRVGSVRCLVIAVVAISGKFSRKVCLGLDIELRARKVLHKVLKVKPVE